MSLEEVKKELIKKAKEDSQKIIKEGEEGKKKIFEKVEEKLEKKKEIVDNDIENLKDVLEKKEISSTELNCQKAILEEKKKIIDDVFEKAKEKLRNQSKDERKNIIDKLISKVEQEIKVEKIYCNDKDKSLVNSGKYQQAEMIGGIIAENKDETIRVDYSYDLLLSNVKEEKLAEISKILFS